MTDDEKKKKEIHDKVGALHLRLLDDEANYHDIIGHMAYYRKDNEHYSEDLLNALRDGLENHERYLNLQNALSPRCIKIVKRPEGEKFSAADTEGASFILMMTAKRLFISAASLSNCSIC